ncbi:putative HD phosphohydrolase [Nonomuraea thailandensis]|uniref:HD phosphohydrolase n=1 Tax=Nonomuraea thailandensis TaxID=1188745 RepID=A0A9X2G8R0_9ACTN|nr:hypothetical protein [Nonomuraea thailandensis]MCP2354614.1 putative HD phosphohydrolase [Nonomuraea thailandensis]
MLSPAELHALQAAAHAVAAGADDELVLAAAFHDVGRAREVATRYRGLPHEQAGAAFARDHLTRRSVWAAGTTPPRTPRARCWPWTTWWRRTGG